MANTTQIDICGTVQTLTNDDISSTSRSIMAFTSLVLAIPSISLYIWILIILIAERKSREFSGAFYRIFTVSSAVEIFFWFFYYYTHGLIATPLGSPFYAWMPEISIPAKVFYFIAYYLTIADCLIPIMLSSNRFTAVVFPLTHDKIWNNTTVNVVIFVFLFFPLIFVWKLLVVKVYNCRLHSKINMAEIRYNIFSVETSSGEMLWINIALSTTCIAIISASLCALLNIITIVALIRRRTKGFNTSSIEIKLFFFSFMIFLSEFLMGMTQNFIYVFSSLVVNVPVVNIFHIFIENIIVDVICFTPPWFLLLTNPQIRDRVLCRRKKGKVYNAYILSHGSQKNQS